MYNSKRSTLTGVRIPNDLLTILRETKPKRRSLSAWIIECTEKGLGLTGTKQPETGQPFLARQPNQSVASQPETIADTSIDYDPEFNQA